MKRKPCPLCTHWHSCRSAEFSSVILELKLGRHIKVPEVIYHLARILSKGSEKLHLCHQELRFSSAPSAFLKDTAPIPHLGGQQRKINPFASE